MDPNKKRLYPIVNTDVALFTLIDLELRVLLIRRANKPDPGGWALPGGIIDPEVDASLEAAALRMLEAKIQVRVPYLAQLSSHSGPKRDPRGWSVSTLFFALLPSDQVPAVAGKKTEAIDWATPDKPGRKLSFDHADMLTEALARLRDDVARGTLPLHLLPPRFTLTELQRACEAILGRPLDKSSFRRQLKEAKSIAKVTGAFVRGPQRPAQVYRAVDNPTHRSW
ncbi:MAG TPA: NUDIX domain-containing protein [Rhodanobacteraceae bacterium]